MRKFSVFAAINSKSDLAILRQTPPMYPIPRRCKLFANLLPSIISSASASMIPLHLDMFRWSNFGQHSTRVSKVRLVKSQHPEMSRYVKLAPQQRRMGKRDFSVTCTQEAKEIEETFEKALSFPSKTRSSWS